MYSKHKLTSTGIATTIFNGTTFIRTEKSTIKYLNPTITHYMVTKNHSNAYNIFKYKTALFFGTLVK